MLQGGRALRPRGARDAEPAVPLSSAGRARRPSASRSVGLRQDRRGGRAPRQRLQGRAGGAESGPPAHAGPGDHASGGLASGDTRTPHWRRQNPGQLQGQGLDRGGRRGRPPWPRLRGAAAEPEAGSPAIGGCGGCPKLSELADAQNGGIVVPGAQGDGTAASASASSRPTSGVDNLRSRAAACSDANHQVTLVSRLPSTLMRMQGVRRPADRRPFRRLAGARSAAAWTRSAAPCSAPAASRLCVPTATHRRSTSHAALSRDCPRPISSSPSTRASDAVACGSACHLLRRTPTVSSARTTRPHQAWCCLARRARLPWGRRRRRQTTGPSRTSLTTSASSP